MKSRILSALLLAVPLAATAGVNPQNGNFFISYKDIAQESGGRELNLVRTYNSQAIELGWFGSGWGSPFETRLIAMPDGSAAVQEHGTGEIKYYRAKEKADIQRGVARIVEAATQAGRLSPEAAAALRSRLVGDEDLRVRRVLQYGLQADLPVNSVRRSDNCTAGALTRIADSYKRTTCDRVNEYFDLQGRLVRREESGGYSVRIDYEGKRPGSIKDTLGQGVSLKWTPAGLLAEASNGKDRVTYAYDKNDNLISSDHASGLRYVFEYDGNHNMTRIGYVDNVSMRIVYSSETNGVVGSVTERSGDRTVYEYRSDPKDAGHTWTKITAISVTGQQSSREFEYRRMTSETGAALLASLAVSDQRNRVETAYDGKGRIIRRTDAAGSVSEYIYHPRNDKLILVLSKDLDTQFHYDAQGNLTHVENSKGRVIDLDYRNTSRIQRVVEVDRAAKTRRELAFKYNADGRPSEITLVGSGRITVEYDHKGDIKKTSSTQGAAMALQVTRAFQNLLSVVRVAGAQFEMGWP